MVSRKSRAQSGRPLVAHRRGTEPGFRGQARGRNRPTQESTGAFARCRLSFGLSRLGLWPGCKLDEARQVVEELKHKAETKAISPMTFAWAYTGMGEEDNAINWLEKAY